ncbi:hypothetical protein [uncultured Legionella sp.]|nr:hypothetical protein [uncultured Legionella sp.]
MGATFLIVRKDNHRTWREPLPLRKVHHPEHSEGAPESWEILRR